MSDFDVIARHRRSFALPARLLGVRAGAWIARLYALCRALDDLVDTDGQPMAFARLTRIRNEVAAEAPVDALSHAALALLPEGPGRDAFRDLISGLISDRGGVALADEAALRLCYYRVAGTVGLMVCAMMHVRLDGRTRARATALESAMQMTNIARDVAEDARAGRRCLPGTWLDLPPAAIAEARPTDRPRIAAATARLIGLSETLYRDGRHGLPDLLPRLRVAVRAAAGVYREIGRVLLARDCDPALPSVFVPAPTRLRALVVWSPPIATPREAVHAVRT